MSAEAADRSPLYLDDLAVGQHFRAGPVTITTEDIVRFAHVFDPQPFHTDPEAAKSTLFKGLAASGWHTAALTMSMLADGNMPLAGGLIGAGAEIAWPRPVRPGDTLRLDSEILEITPSRSRPNQAMVKVRSTTTNQNGEPVQVMTSKMLAFKRP